MRHINRQIMSGYVDRPIKIIKSKYANKDDGVLVFLNCKSSRNSDKYEHRSVIFWGPVGKRFKEFIESAYNKQITVKGKSIRNSVRKKTPDNYSYIQTYDQIKATDFCLGSIDLWKNPHAGEMYKFRQDNVQVNNIVEDMFNDEEGDKDE